MSIVGKRALITGASQGFGLAVARAFVQAGADVMLCARSPEALRQAHGDLVDEAKGEARVLACLADVASPDDVKRLVGRTVSELGSLDVLVSNAGVYGPKGPVEQVPWDEWSAAISVNLLGTVLVCREVLPHFKEQKRGKIILLSGGGATKPLPFLSAYAASKAAVVRFGETLAEEVRDFGIDVNAVAPGALNTRLLEEVLAAGPDKVGALFYRAAERQKEEGGTPLATGASLCVFLASVQSDGLTGRLISAVWDPWSSLAEHREELNQSDIYTLRRIVPGDRGKSWE